MNFICLHFGLNFQGKYEFVSLRESILIFTHYFQVGYDDVAMIRYKSEYIRKMGLGGGMVWALDLDDFKNRCGQGHHPLMNTIKEVLGPKITVGEQEARTRSAPPLSEKSQETLDIFSLNIANATTDLDLEDIDEDETSLDTRKGASAKKVVCCKYSI